MKISVLVLASLIMVNIAEAQIPRTLSYQGVLTDASGVPRPNGNYSGVFRLYTSSGGGSPIWMESKTISIKRGFFSTLLGDVTPFPDSIRFNRPYWLGIAVAPDPEVTPRTELSTAPYSMNSLRADTAQYARGGPGGGGPLALPYADSGSSPNAIFFVSNQGTGGGMFGHSRISPGVFGGSDSASAVMGITSGTLFATSGVVGIATAESGYVNGVYGISVVSPNGVGTVGWGRRTGVLGTSDVGSGVVGSSTSHHGVSGVSNTGIGVRGEATQVASGAYGVYGVSPGLIGVFGENTGTGGSASGVMGKTAALNGAGVRGLSTNLGGVNYGVIGITESNQLNAAGVRGEATSSSGQTIGVEGVATSSPIGTGIVGRGSATGGYFEAFNADGYAGVFNGKVSANVLQITGGSDLAEPFEIRHSEELEPGTVVSIDPTEAGMLSVSKIAYDAKVAGVVSGANGVNPGITLTQKNSLEGTHMVAIAGRVYCRAEADSSPIEPGDLLTTSPLHGLAMKAVDRVRSQGAIIGKAMSGLKSGKGLILVIVNLQ